MESVDTSSERTRRRWLSIGLTGLLLLVIAACTPALSAPGDTSKVQLVSTSTVNGWRYDFYRNVSYPCSISGHQTFTIATKVGSSPTATKPLWVFLHGGGYGFFAANGTPVPDTNNLTEETASRQRSSLAGSDDLFERVRADAAGFRLMAVSYCNRDLYSGAKQTDPNNPNTNADGSAKTTNGLLANKAAIQYAEATFPTSTYFLHGGSAGSAGSYYNAWALQKQGIPPAGVVGDASVVNKAGGSAGFDQGACTSSYNPIGQAAIEQRVHPDIAKEENEVDRLVARGDLTVPLLHLWNIGDKQSCGNVQMQCPLRDGTTVTLGNTDCLHRPLRDAITAQGPSSRSLNMRLCVLDAATPNVPCGKHVVTTGGPLTNTDPAWPSDFLAPVMDWVHARLAD